MDSLSLAAGKLAHSLGGSARRRSQRHVKPHALKDLEYTPESGGLARTGAAREDKYSFLNGELYRLFLQFIVANAADKLGICYLLVYPRVAARRKPLHKEYHLRGVALGLIHLGQKYIFPAADIVRHKKFAVNELIYPDIYFVAGAPEQVEARSKELLPRQAGVAVHVAVVAHDIDYARVDTVFGRGRAWQL